ncbi:unnamed protein product [Lampetra fluviatilis]
MTLLLLLQLLLRFSISSAAAVFARTGAGDLPADETTWPRREHVAALCDAFPWRHAESQNRGARPEHVTRRSSWIADSLRPLTLCRAPGSLGPPGAAADTRFADLPLAGTAAASSMALALGEALANTRRWCLRREKLSARNHGSVLTTDTQDSGHHHPPSTAG